MSGQNNWYVITGGPSTGKTTLLRELQKLGHKTIPETARLIIDEGLSKGLSLGQIRADEKKFQELVLRRKLELEATHDPSLLTFFDRGMHDTLAYLKHYQFMLEDWIHEAVKKAQYQKVFLLDPLPHYQPDYARVESQSVAEKLQELLYEAYAGAGMEPVRVPVLPPEERARYVLRHAEEITTLNG